MIIVECCTNFDSISMAKEMIKTARSLGDVLVKFQLFNAEEDKGKPHYDWVKSHELSFEQAKELFDYGKSIGQEVFFSVFGAEYVKWCEEIGVRRYKLAYGVTEKKLLDALANVKKPVIISTTSADWNDIYANLYAPRLIQTVPKYPAQIDDYYFPLEGTMLNISDHTIGLDAAKIALARGAQTIEKHFVLEHDSKYPDNDWSMTPDDLKELIRFKKVCRRVL